MADCNMKQLKLGSLFDGSGGFPLAGVLHGIEPVWASEIEPFPIRVTKLRFPNMKHLGSVTDINGAEIEPVDIITFGSPCQDLSVAGKQLGIHDGERSNLFFEAIRIIKEMREHDRATGRADIDVRPRFAVWENVPGAFSSNKGRDFQAVLQALCEIKGTAISIPMPPKNKWLPAGCIVGNDWSVAWRVYDAQYWGVPQRRKRIYLIADFASQRAGEILFECESVRGDSAESREAREGTAADAQGSAGRSDSVGFTNRGYESGNVTETLRAESHNALPCVAVGSAGRSDCAIGCDLYNGQLTGDKAATLGAKSGVSAGHSGPSVCLPAAFMGGQGAKARSIAYCKDGTAPTLKSTLSGGNTVPDVVYPINTMVATRGGKDDMRTCFGIGEPNDPQFTLQAAHEHPVCFQCCGDRNNPSVSTSEKAYCIPANPMSDRQQAVCFQQNQRDEVRDMGEQTGALTAESGMHNRNYVCFRKSSKPGADGNGEKWVEDETANTLNTFEFHSDARTPEVVCYPDKARSLCARADSSPCIDRGQNVVCVQNTGRGWWNEGEVAETLRTPCGGDSTKANLVVHALDCRNMADNVEVSGTIQAKNEGGHSLNFINPVVYDARGNGGV